MPKLLSFFAVLLLALPVAAQTPAWKKWEAQADTLMDRQDFSGAIRYYTKVIKKTKLKDRDAFGSLYKRAVAYYSIGDFPHALSDLDAFIPAYPLFPQAFLLRALTHKGLGDTEKQLADLSEALRYQQGNAGLLKWRASLYLDADEYELALKDALQAKELEDDAEVEMYLGFAQYNLDQFEEAIESINRAIQFDATYLPAYLYAGSFCLEQEQYARGLEYLNLALRLDPNNIAAIMYKGVALVELNQLDEGCRCLRKAFYNGEDQAGEYLKEFCYGLGN